MTTTQVQTTQKENVFQLIRKQQSQFQMVLGSPEQAERFVRVALTEVRRNPKLASCETTSFLGSLMQGAQLKLDIALEHYYIIPYFSSKNKCFEAQFQFGYKGLIELFYRHPLASELYAETVCANDKFKCSLGTDRRIEHIPNYMEERGEPILYYAVAKLKTGAINFAIMRKKEVDAHRKHYSKTNTITPWDTAYEDMAKKTVIKKVLKYMPKSVEMEKALMADESVKYVVGEIHKPEELDELPVSYPEFLTEPEEQPKIEEKTKTEKQAPQDLNACRINLIDIISGLQISEKEKDELLERVNKAKTVEELQSINNSMME